MFHLHYHRPQHHCLPPSLHCSFFPFATIVRNYIINLIQDFIFVNDVFTKEVISDVNECFRASPRESLIHSLKVSVIIIILILCSFVTSDKFRISLLIMPTFFLSWANLLHKAAVAGLLDSLFIFVSILLTFKTSSCSSLWIEGFYLILSDISYKNSGRL